MVSRILLLFCAVLSSACATTQKPSVPGSAEAAPATDRKKEFVVRTPGPEWLVIPNTVIGGVPAMLALVNKGEDCIIKFDAMPSEGLSPSMRAMQANDKLSENGITVSNIDFSDPTGGRASFTYSYVEEGVAQSGKIEVMRLHGEDGVVFMATGVWPTASDVRMLKVFDVIVASAKVR
jgi:hypothetical protein